MEITFGSEKQKDPGRIAGDAFADVDFEKRVELAAGVFFFGLDVDFPIQRFTRRTIQGCKEFDLSIYAFIFILMCASEPFPKRTRD